MIRWKSAPCARGGRTARAAMRPNSASKRKKSPRKDEGQIPSRRSGGPDRAGLAELMTTRHALTGPLACRRACFAPFPCGDHRGKPEALAALPSWLWTLRIFALHSLAQRHRSSRVLKNGVGSRSMCVVPAALAMEVALAITTRVGRLARAVLRAKALRARPGLQQRAIDREVFARRQMFDLVLRQHRREKLGCHIPLQQPVAVLGEGCGIPHRVLDAEPDKPPKQQIVVDPLDQLPLRADRVERLQQQRASAAPAGSTPGRSANTAWRTR